jgi:hypothetical protein
MLQDLANEAVNGYVIKVVDRAPPAKDFAMTPLPMPCRFTASALVLSLFGATATAQPPRRPLDPLAQARAGQTIADQKATVEVLGVIQTAERQAKSNPVKAVQTLKAAQVIIDSPVLSTEARKGLLELLQNKIAIIEGRRPVIEAGPRIDTKAAAIKYDKKTAYETMTAELKAVNDGVRKIARYHDAGLTKEADHELALLAKAYPNNPSVIMLQEKDTFATRVADSLAFSKNQSDRIVATNNDLMRSSLPSGGRDVEFPADWKKLSERRLQGVKLSKKEQAIIEALDKPTTVNWNNTMLEEALQELSTQMNQNLFVDKKSLADLDIELNKPVKLRATGVSIRTVLRQILATQGLTFVVKDESIQVVTVEKARGMLVTRVYYLGDLVRSTGPFGGAPQWGPFIDYQQTMANVEVIMKSITKSVDPLSWRDAGGAGTVTFHYPSMSIIVRASSEVHATLGAKMGGGR